MSGADDQVDIILYGATGYTGRLIVDELARSGRSFVLAGRDLEALVAVARTCPTPPEVEAVRVDDAAGLDRLARRCRVLISAAGPFVDLGPPVLEAALRAGTHFLDITGEQAFLRWADQQHARAQDAGSTVVNGMGFDVVPSDIAALVATTAMRRVVSLDLAIRSNAGTSGGTRRSMARSSGTGAWFDQGTFRPAPPGRFRRDFAFPAPWGPQAGVFVPWGDVVTAPRSTGAERVRTFFAVPRSSADRMHRLWPLTWVAERTGMLERRLAKKAKPSGAGPDAARRAEATFQILAEAVDEEGLLQRGLVEGRDPYGFTAASVVHGAGLLLDHGTQTGVLTPTQAFTFGPFVQEMARFDLKWRARSLT